MTPTIEARELMREMEFALQCAKNICLDNRIGGKGMVSNDYIAAAKTKINKALAKYHQFEGEEGTRR